MKMKLIDRKDLRINRDHYLFSNKMLMALIVPLIFEQLLLIFVGMVDSIMVASVGEAAVSGVSLFDNIMMLIISVLAALSTGGAVVAGQFLGQKNRGRAVDATNQLVWFLGGFGMVLMVIIYIIKPFILNNLFGKIEPLVYQHADTYLMIVALSIPFLAIYNGAAAIFRTMGNSKVTMKVSFLMNGINVVFNAILIYGFGMGVAGAAIGSLISRAVAGIVMVGLLMDDNLELHLFRSFYIKYDFKMIYRILKYGVPNGIENGMFQLGKVLLLSMIATFGTASIAANAIGSILAGLQVLPGLALAMAMTTVTSRCVGANDFEQAKYYNIKLIKITYGIMFVTNLIIYFSLPIIFRAYHLSAETAALTKSVVTLHTFCSMLIWPLAFDLPVTFRAAGDVKTPMIISTISMWSFRLVLGYILGKVAGFGLLGVWIAMIIDWIFRSTLYILRYVSGKWMHYRMEEH